MDLRQVRYFLAVIDHGGYHKAADHLLVSQPSVSQSIKNLENELGVPLFHRIGRRAVLSAAGADFAVSARALLRDADAAVAAARSHVDLEVGRVDVVTMPSPGVEPLTRIVGEFHAERPGILLDIAGAFTPEEVVSEVRAGTAEIGLVGTATPLRSGDLDVTPLAAQPLVLVVSPRHDAFAPGRAITPGDLDGQPFVVSHRGSLMRSLVDDVIARGGRAHIVVEIEHRTSILPFVLAGIGHAVLPSSWTFLAEASGLRTVPIEPPTVLHVAAVSRRDHLTPGARAFLGVARRHASAPISPP